MFRKSFRFKRLALGMAFASLIVPVTPAAAATLSTFVDGGPAPVSFAPVSSYQPSYLRYHEVGVPVATHLSTPVSAPAVATASGFDWTDAGIGASTTLGVGVLLGMAILFTRRNQNSGLTHA